MESVRSLLLISVLRVHALGGAFDGFDDPVIGELRGSCRLTNSFGRLRLEDVQDRLVTGRNVVRR